jgi:ABC-type Zn uptake system ZnuABC Zn-binding protein ZnuA
MFHIKSTLLLPLVGSTLVGSVLVASLWVPNAIASTNTTTAPTTTANTSTMNAMHGSNLSGAAAGTSDNTSAPNMNSTEKLNVVTSVSPITNIVKNVAGDRITLTGLVPEGVNSHTFELVPSDIIRINDADLVIIDGLGLEINVEDVVEQAQDTNPDRQILKLGDNSITPDQYVFDFSFPKEGGDPNPHLWLNVPYAMKFANLTRDKLIEMDPANADYYSENADKYITKLKQLDEGIMKAVQTVPEGNRKLLTYHDSWAYFAPRYGMVVIGAIQPSDFGQPTPREVANLIDQIKTENVPAIFGSEVFPTEVVDQIATEANVQIVGTLSDDDLPGNPGDPQNSYVGMMLENMENMLVPLGGNVSALSNVDPTDSYSSD